jgi:hypothetical protein
LSRHTFRGEQCDGRLGGLHSALELRVDQRHESFHFEVADVALVAARALRLKQQVVDAWGGAIGRCGARKPAFNWPSSSGRSVI